MWDSTHGQDLVPPNSLFNNAGARLWKSCGFPQRYYCYNRLSLMRQLS